MCFNCDGTGLCVVYPQIHRMIMLRKERWILSPNLAWEIRECPYCDDNSTHFGLIII